MQESIIERIVESVSRIGQELASSCDLFASLEEKKE
jgi:hypothetical protein